jgi:hypothetical protein
VLHIRIGQKAFFHMGSSGAYRFSCCLGGMFVLTRFTRLLHQAQHSIVVFYQGILVLLHLGIP